MKTRNRSIQRKLMRALLLISGVTLLLISFPYVAYEFVTFRTKVAEQISTEGKIIASNSTAAVAFQNETDANEILSALKAEKNIVAAGLFDNEGRVLAKYISDSTNGIIPAQPLKDTLFFKGKFLEAFIPVVQDHDRLGTLYLQSSMTAIYRRFWYYAILAVFFGAVTFLLAAYLSIKLQKNISGPILDLSETAKVISEISDYSIRATKWSNDEVGMLTDAFNQMLLQIETQNKEIASLNADLEEKIKNRTFELQKSNDELRFATEQLQTINAALAKSNRDLEQFAYVAGHDLQEPLRKIQTFTQLTQKNINDTNTVETYLDKIRVSAQRMSQLIAAVLQYSRLSKGEEGFESVDLNHVLSVVLTDLELLISEKNARIESSDLPVIDGMPLQLQQLFANLINNALKFTETAPVVKIHCRLVHSSDVTILQSDGHRDYFEISFFDNGIGFEQKYADKIFTIFQRLNPKEEYAGTGIGLALCKKIVENHRGQIMARGEINKGATFIVYFPRKNDPPKVQVGERRREIDKK